MERDYMALGKLLEVTKTIDKFNKGDIVRL
jgi:hypothetical protein